MRVSCVKWGCGCGGGLVNAHKKARWERTKHTWLEQAWTCWVWGCLRPSWVNTGIRGVGQRHSQTYKKQLKNEMQTFLHFEIHLKKILYPKTWKLHICYVKSHARGLGFCQRKDVTSISDMTWTWIMLAQIFPISYHTETFIKTEVGCTVLNHAANPKIERKYYFLHFMHHNSYPKKLC